MPVFSVTMPTTVATEESTVQFDMQVDDTMYQHVRAQQKLETLEQRLKATEQPLFLSSQHPSVNTTTVSTLLSA